jgi:hypothetical protein
MMGDVGADVIVALIGAVVGAILGAIGASLVTRQSVLFERKIAAYSAILALADEARFNANVVRHLQDHLWGSEPSALEREALDMALPFLHVLPTALRDRAREARASVLFMIYIETMFAKVSAKQGAAPKSMLDTRQQLISVLPTELESLASDIEAFIKKNRWTWQRIGHRSASPN